MPARRRAFRERPRPTCRGSASTASSAGRPFEDWLAPAGAVPAPVSPGPDWPFNIIYSSGTTGTPKGIVQPHAMRWAQVRRGGGAYGYGPDTVTLVATPLYSNTTLVVFLPTMAWGGTAVLMPKFNALEYLRLAERHRVTHAMLVPVQYQRLMALPEFGDFDLSSLPDEVLHQRAVRRGAQGRRAGALAGRPGRVLRHDRRRRQLRPGGAPASRQAAHRRPADGGPRHPPDRRRRPRARRRARPARSSAAPAR